MRKLAKKNYVYDRAARLRQAQLESIIASGTPDAAECAIGDLLRETPLPPFRWAVQYLLSDFSVR